jgi:hypothetical protein
MNTETITKEVDASGVYFRRIVLNPDGALVSDERVKRDSILSFAQPPTLQLDEGGAGVTLAIEFHLSDYDGEARTYGGAINFRLQDRDVPDDDGVVFARQLVNGSHTLSIEFDAAGQYVLTVEPPLVADMQLIEPVRIRVE